MNMLMRKVEPSPYAGELQTAVDHLADILAPVDLVLSAVDAAREDQRAAAAHLGEAKANCDAVYRRYAQAIAEARTRGLGEPAEVQNARRLLDQAEARRIETRQAFIRAKEKQGAAFFRDVMPQIDQAAPTLLEVVRLLNDAVDPLAKLHSHATMHGLPLPRLLMGTPVLCEATRAMTAILNDATAPSP